MAKQTNEQKYKTAEERNDAFNEWCFNRDCESCELKAHKFDGGAGCRFYWLALEAEEKKIEPCFYCGNKHIAITKNGNNHWSVSCRDCLYESLHHMNRDTAISAHNRVARAVRAAKESEVRDE